MNPSRLQEFHAVRRALAVILLLASPGITYLKWDAANGAINVMNRTPRPVSPTDSLAYASAVYHGSHAMADQAGRWGPTGYATFGTAGFTLGLILAALPWMRRAKAKPTSSA